MSGRPVRNAFAGLLALIVAGWVGFAAGPGGAQATLDPPVQRSDIPPPLLPQTQPTGPMNGKVLPARATDAPSAVVTDPASETGLDYAAWDAMAVKAETALGNAESTNIEFDLLRAQLVDWREALLAAQSVNSARIATLRQQIGALGPVPAEGETEAPAIAARRAELTEQLSLLQAPGIEADEAYRRADGLIKEIDRVVRERQADELLQLWPSPVNPANWPAAMATLSDTALTLVREFYAQSQKPAVRAEAVDNLPAVVVLTLVGLLLLLRGRALASGLMRRTSGLVSARAGRVLVPLISLLQIILPFLGAFALFAALTVTGVPGVLAMTALSALPPLAFSLFSGLWLAGRIFSTAEISEVSQRMAPEARAQGRWLVAWLGLMLGLEAVLVTVFDTAAIGETSASVLAFPSLVLTALPLYRLGGLIRSHAQSAADQDERTGYVNSVMKLLGQVVCGIGVIGPVLAAIGYVSAAQALVFPAVLSLGLIGVLIILQRLIGNIYAWAMRDDAGGREALIPVLVGFALTLASLPAFALIWGARAADITEIWAKFQEGYKLGETQISPSSFLYFLVIFAFGYLVTRLFQGALRGSILPRTQLDQGGQNAIVSGTGYIGIFLAGLIAINAAGIDLSGIAIVAGALSVGIGFGLQTIVSNFVSGIILLIERPISEGDWIEVGGVQGTVKSIAVRATRIQTFDRTDVIVPNQDLVAGRVTNWTRFSLSGRLIVPVGVAFGSDTRKVERVLRQIAEEQPLAVLSPPPIIAFMGFGPDAMMFEIRMILRDVNFSLSVRSEINHRIVEVFADEGIEIPSAQQDVTLRNVEALGLALRGLVPLPAGAAPEPLLARPAPFPAASPAHDPATDTPQPSEAR